MHSDYAILKSAGTAVISDIFDTLGLEPPVLDNSLSPIGQVTAFAGPAYTVTGKLQDYRGGDHAKLEAIDNMSPGVVALWAGQDARGVCCFGDLLATAMRARGCAAAVVDGGVRDVHFLKDCGLPVLARYRSPAQGVGRWKVTASQTPVQVRGALRDWLTVSPGDLLVGDADGVICIPQNLASQVLPKAKQWSEGEDTARHEIAAGLPLLDALKKFGHL
jgi:regulator of RNase E activity RraA